jgi:hypothetical protein
VASQSIGTLDASNRTIQIIRNSQNVSRDALPLDKTSAFAGKYAENKEGKIANSYKIFRIRVAWILRETAVAADSAASPLLNSHAEDQQCK